MESKPNPEEDRILLPALTTNYGTSPPNVKEPSKQTIYIESSKDSEVSVPLPRVQFILAIASLFIAIFLVSLDNTIVSTALRGMIMDLGKQELAPWVGSAYMVTSAGFATLYGRFADIFGRKWVFMFAMAMFEIGSLICGVAQTMETLIVGRAIAGVGGGGMNAMVLIMISDIVSIRDRGKYQGLVGAAVGVASILGPIVGGAFSDSSVSWRWCFYINIPFGMVAMGVVSLLRFPPFTGNMAEKLKRIDYFGALTIFLAILCLICPLQLGGSTWEWNSAPVLIMFPLSAVFFAIFVFVELRMAKDPIVPAGMFVNQNVPTLLAYAISLGAIFFSAIYFISMFFQVVFNNTATQAGVSTIPLVLGMVVTTIGSGIFVSKTEKYVPLLYAGPVFMVIGATLTAFLDGNSSVAQRIFYLFFLGMGCGFVFQTRVMALQSSVPAQYIAVVTALASTCLLLGGAIGIAVTGTIFNNLIASKTLTAGKLQLTVGMIRKAGHSADTSEVMGLLELMKIAAEKYPQYASTIADARIELVVAFNDSFKIAYLSMLAYPIILLVLALFVKQINPSGSDRSHSAMPLLVE